MLLEGQKKILESTSKNCFGIRLSFATTKEPLSDYWKRSTFKLFFYIVQLLFVLLVLLTKILIKETFFKLLKIKINIVYDLK